MRAAEKLLDRALELLAPEDRERSALLSDLGRVLFEAGDWERADRVLSEAMERARATGDVASEGIAFLRHTVLALFMLRFEHNAEALPGVERVIATFETIGHDRGLAEGFITLGSIQFWTGMAGTAARSFETAVEHLRRTDDRARYLDALRFRSLADTFGPTPADAALERLDRLAQSEEGRAPVLRSTIARLRAILLAMRGDHAGASSALAEVVSLTRELGMEVEYAAGALRSALWVASAAGDDAAAEAAGQEAVEVLRRIGDLGHLSSMASDLAEVVWRRHRASERAMALSEEAERATLGGDVDAEIRWRAVRARIVADQGNLDQAVSLARDAADRARATDYLDLVGTTLLALADVLDAAGRHEEAADALLEAATAFERKGYVVALEQTRARLRQRSSGSGMRRDGAAGGATGA